MPQGPRAPARLGPILRSGFDATHVVRLRCLDLRHELPDTRPTHGTPLGEESVYLPLQNSILTFLRCFTRCFKYSSCHIHLLSVDFCERSDFGASFSHLFAQQQTLSPAMAPQRVAKATRGAATLPSSLWTAGALCLVAVGGSAELMTQQGKKQTGIQAANCEWKSREL